MISIIIIIIIIIITIIIIIIIIINAVSAEAEGLLRPFQRSKLTFSKNRLLATFKKFSRQKYLEVEDT